ncbi:MAG: hypothetical protein F6K28_40145 [Microcoleus sp. SIO2G3]|nr:hypothetical protein [Microcoleus sp. SIO2G3]
MCHPRAEVPSALGESRQATGVWGKSTWDKGLNVIVGTYGLRLEFNAATT